MPLVRENSLLYEVIKVSTVDGEPLAVADGLSIPEHDFISISPSAAPSTGNQTITYKLGGSGGTTVATVTLAFVDSNISTVTKS
jgi:hypothetical protein